MKFTKKKSIWVQIVLVQFLGMIAIYLALFLTSPYFQYVDDVKCGVDTLLGFDCHFKFRG